MKMTFENPPKHEGQRGNFMIPAQQLRKLSEIWAVMQTLNQPARIALAVLAHDHTNGSRLVPSTARTQPEFGCFLRNLELAGALPAATAEKIRQFAAHGVMPSNYERRPDWTGNSRLRTE